MSNSSRIALVTVLFNCERHLQLFFECLARQRDRDFIVIVIDNASRDASFVKARELAQLHNVTCEFIGNKVNLGIAEGNNQGIEAARRFGVEHIVLINNDISCDENLIEKIRAKAVAQKEIAWTCLAWYGDSDRRWYGGGRLSWWRARGLHYNEERSAQIKKPTLVSYAPTCLMYLHATVFERIGMMDTRYFVYYDDTDFCRRMYDAGIPLLYDPTVSFRHYVGGSSGGDLSPFFLRISTRNKFYYIRKHYRVPARWMVAAIAFVSKLSQLLSTRRRGPTWEGIVDAFRV